MKPCPEDALPVVEWIRREVKRPDVLPESKEAGRFMRWDRKCPMGLLPCAFSYLPMITTEFKSPIPEDIGDDELAAFYHWWDMLPAADAQEAVDFIWPVSRAAD